MPEEASRANWNFLYEKGLVEILTEHKVDPRFKGQNGWNSAGWNSVHKMLCEKFPLARFTKRQLQDTEKDLKGSFKAINNASKESGTGWSESMGMITAEPDLMKKCEKKFSRIKKYRKNGFPLFRICEVLYEGSIATGDLSFTSTELLEPVHNAPTQILETEQNVPSPPEPREPREHSEVANPFSSSVAVQEVSEAQSAPSGTSTQQHESRKKRKQNQVPTVLDDYLEHKKRQSDKTFA